MCWRNELVMSGQWKLDLSEIFLNNFLCKISLIYGSKGLSSLLFLIHTASSIWVFHPSGPGGPCVIWPGPAVLAASSLLLPLLFNIDEILVCVGGDYSIPMLTSLPSWKFKKAVHTAGPFGWSSKVKCRWKYCLNAVKWCLSLGFQWLLTLARVAFDIFRKVELQDWCRF